METNNAQVIFSDSSYLAIMAETYEKVGTETGGIFLGKYFEGKWYVLEVIDPGPNSIFQPAYFEYDTSYVNHLSNKIARFYKNGLELIGLWHRHPGSYSHFSATDDSTNREYAKICKNGAISALVNLDPNFRITVFYVPSSLKYIKLNYLVGSSYIPNEISLKKLIKDFIPTKIQSQSWKPPEDKDSIGIDYQFDDSDNKPTSLLDIFRSIFYHGTQIRGSSSSESHPRNINPINSSFILNSIESEIIYLQSQADYDFSLKKINENELLLIMKYAGKMRNYPEVVRVIFGIGQDNNVYVKTEKNIYKYMPGFLQNYFSKNISFD